MFLSYGPCPECQVKISPGRLPKVSVLAAASKSLPIVFSEREPPHLATLLRGPDTGDKRNDEPQAHTDGRTDRRISWYFCADSLWPRRRRHGRSVSLEQSRRDDPRRLHQHHAGMGACSHDGNLCGWQDFWRTSESGSHAGARRLSRLLLAQGIAILYCADGRSLRRGCRRLLELLAGLPPCRSATRPHGRGLHHVSSLPRRPASRIS